MPSFVSRSSWAAKRPSVTTTFGLDELDLLLQPRPARRDLLGPGIAVLGRPALHDVRDVALVAGQPELLREQPVEELARPPDERQTLAVLFGTRSLADEHQVGVGAAHAEHDLRATGGERAASARRGLHGHARSSVTTGAARVGETPVRGARPARPTGSARSTARTVRKRT